MSGHGEGRQRIEGEVLVGRLVGLDDDAGGDRGRVTERAGGEHVRTGGEEDRIVAAGVGRRGELAIAVVGDHPGARDRKMGPGIGDRTGQGAAGLDEIDGVLRVDAAFAVDIIRVVVARVRRAAAAIRAVDGRHVEGVEDRVIVAEQSGLRRQHEGDRAGRVGRGHRGARERFVTAARDARDDIDAGGRDVRAYLAGRRWAAAREEGDVVVVVGRTEADDLVEVARRSGGAAAELAGVARGEDRDDSRGAPCLDRLEIERVVGVVAAPRVADKIRNECQIRIVSRHVRRGDDELARRQERLARAAEVLAALGRDPLRAWRDARIRGERAGTVAAGDRAHRVGPVTDVVARLAGARSGRVPPVVVVAECPVVVVAAVVADESGVHEIDAGVDGGHDDAGPGDALGPDLVGADLGDAPLRVAGGGEDRRLDRDGLHERIDLLRVDAADALDRSELPGECLVTGDDEAVRQPVALRVRALDGLGDLDRLRLGALGSHAERVVDSLCPRCMTLLRGGGPEVGLGRELDDEALAALAKIRQQLLVDGRRRGGAVLATTGCGRSECGSRLSDDEDERGQHRKQPTSHRQDPPTREPACPDLGCRGGRPVRDMR